MGEEPVRLAVSGQPALKAEAVGEPGELGPAPLGDPQVAGLIGRVPRVVPIDTWEYPTPARRPAYSCLDTACLSRDFGVTLPDWKEGVADVLG